MPNIIERSCLSNCEYFLSVELRDRDAKATGRSVPSGHRCYSTAPSPYRDAPHDNMDRNELALVMTLTPPLQPEKPC